MNLHSSQEDIYLRRSRVEAPRMIELGFLLECRKPGLYSLLRFPPLPLSGRFIVHLPLILAILESSFRLVSLVATPLISLILFPCCFYQ